MSGGFSQIPASTYVVTRDDGSAVSIDDNSGSITVDSTDLDVRDLTAASDEVVAFTSTSAIYDANTALTPKFAAIATNTSGDNTLVTGVANKKIRVIALTIVTNAANNVYFTTAAAGTVIFGGSSHKMNLPASGIFVLPANPWGWFETVAGQALVINLSAASAVSGGLVYLEV